jgi:hypothetical protein
MLAFFVLFWIFSLAASIFLAVFFDCWRWVKKYGMKDCIRERIERKRNFYFTLFIWSLDLAGACWLAIIFSVH